MSDLLYIYWQPSEVAVHLGSFAIRWYSLCWLLGLAGGFFLMKWLYKRHHYSDPASYPHLRAHETVLELVCLLPLAKKNNKHNIT